MSSSQQPLQERDSNVNAASSAQGEDASNGAPKPKKAAPKKAQTKFTAAELSDVQLEGEDSESVRIFDTCDDVRRMINKYLAATNTNKAAFARELSEMLPRDEVKAHQLSKFLTFKGPLAGGHSPAFYAGYVWFEKIRVKQGKNKTAKRQRMADAWHRDGGVPREGSHNMRFWTGPGTKPRMDSLGRVTIA